MINIVLCGGSGTRLWPLSRMSFPKQYVKLTGEQSLFQETVRRNAVFCDSFCFVTSADHLFLARNQVESVLGKTYDSRMSFVLEPVGRNTAPAIAIACMGCDPDDIVFVTPSDHLIHDLKSYGERVATAKKCAEGDKLVTFGIKPLFPETGYGYIETVCEAVEGAVCDVKSFREKPDQKTAERYVAEGKYLWNSGMFLFKAGLFLEELKNYSPAIYSASQTAFNRSKRTTAKEKYETLTISMDEMKAIPSNSIDYAVMEKSPRVSVVVSDIGWNDLGSFDSIYDVRPKDADGNTIAENIIAIDSHNNLAIPRERLISLVGVDDLIVVDTNDALLIAKRGESQKVKDIVSRLNSGTVHEQELSSIHTTAHRPWGTYTVLEERPGFKIKKFVVHKGKRLSLQKHYHRSEHWVVVSGTAVAQLGKEEHIVRKNESIYIPIGEIHRVTNTGKIDLVIIETQVGDYLGEDDIERIEDDFNRVE